MMVDHQPLRPLAPRVFWGQETSSLIYDIDFILKREVMANWSAESFDPSYLLLNGDSPSALKNLSRRIYHDRYSKIPNLEYCRNLESISTIGGVSLASFHPHAETIRLGISDDEINRFVEPMTQALTLISDVSPPLFQLQNFLVTWYLPMFSSNPVQPLRGLGSGFSSMQFFGGVFLSLPNIDENLEVELALNMCHELGHQCLIRLQSTDRIILNSQTLQLYSGVRKTFRPAILSFHALTALNFMLKFLSDVCESPHVTSTQREYAKQRFADHLKDYELGLRAFENVALTRLGRELLQGFITVGKTWSEFGSKIT